MLDTQDLREARRGQGWRSCRSDRDICTQYGQLYPGTPLTTSLSQSSPPLGLLALAQWCTAPNSWHFDWTSCWAPITANPGYQWPRHSVPPYCLLLPRENAGGKNWSGAWSSTACLDATTPEASQLHISRSNEASLFIILKATRRC